MNTVRDLIEHYYSPAWQARTIKKLAKFGVNADEVLTESLVLFLGNLISKLNRDIINNGTRNITRLFENAGFVLESSSTASKGHVESLSREHRQETQEPNKAIQPIQTSTDGRTGRNCDESSKPSELPNKAAKQQSDGVLSDNGEGLKYALELLKDADDLFRRNTECVRQSNECVRRNTEILGTATRAVGNLLSENAKRLEVLRNGEYTNQREVHSNVRGARILDFHGKVHTDEAGVTTVKTTAVEVID